MKESYTSSVCFKSKLREKARVQCSASDATGDTADNCVSFGEKDEVLFRDATCGIGANTACIGGRVSVSGPMTRMQLWEGLA